MVAHFGYNFGICLVGNVGHDFGVCSVSHSSHDFKICLVGNFSHHFGICSTGHLHNDSSFSMMPSSLELHTVDSSFVALVALVAMADCPVSVFSK